MDELAAIEMETIMEGLVGMMVVMMMGTMLMPPRLPDQVFPPSPSGLQGKVRGYVHETGEHIPLEGAVVDVAGTWQAVSDTYGDYYITGIEPGDHIITASYPGYATRTYGPWTFYPDETRVLNVVLFPL